MAEPTTGELIADLLKPLDVSKLRTFADGITDDSPGLTNIIALGMLQQRAANRLALLSRQNEELRKAAEETIAAISESALDRLSERLMDAADALQAILLSSAPSPSETEKSG